MSAHDALRLTKKGPHCYEPFPAGERSMNIFLPEYAVLAVTLVFIGCNALKTLFADETAEKHAEANGITPDGGTRENGSR